MTCCPSLHGATPGSKHLRYCCPSPTLVKLEWQCNLPHTPSHPAGVRMQHKQWSKQANQLITGVQECIAPGTSTRPRLETSSSATITTCSLQTLLHIQRKLPPSAVQRLQGPQQQLARMHAGMTGESTKHAYNIVQIWHTIAHWLQIQED